MLTRNLKVVAVGDGEVGKTCLISVFANDCFPGEYIPTVYDNKVVNIVYDATLYSLSIWDTAGQEEFDCLRPVAYPQTDYFLVCFSLLNRDSLTNVLHKWVPELRHHRRDTPIILVGTKSDLRISNRRSNTLHHDFQRESVSTEEGWAVAKRIGASDYVECSAAHLLNVKPVFEAGIRAMQSRATKSNQQRRKQMKQKKCCSIL